MKLPTNSENPLGNHLQRPYSSNFHPEYTKGGHFRYDFHIQIATAIGRSNNYPIIGLTYLLDLNFRQRWALPIELRYSDIQIAIGLR